MKRQAVLILLLFGGILLQTTIVHFLPLDISPDISLIMLVYFSFRYGSSTSQVSGFASGLLEDFLSLAPLGFNCFIKTVVGFLTGLFHERFIMDSVIFPLLSVVLLTFLKGVLSLLLVNIFSISLSAVNVFSHVFLIEIVANAFLAPLIFRLMRLLLDWLLPERKAL